MPPSSQRGRVVAVTVYFKNSGSCTSQEAMTVKHETFPQGEDDREAGHFGIALYDGHDRVIGRFQQSEIVGYFLHGVAPR
jgi:hypothetical protein